LDRVGLQYGYAAEDELGDVDVNKHDYVDQTPSLDATNGNADLRMHVGEGVIFYPWMEEEFFYNTRRFLGKIWYDARIPCEYALAADEVADDPERFPSSSPSGEDSGVPSTVPSTVPSMEPSSPPTLNRVLVAADILVSVLIKDGPLPPMPEDVKKVFEKTVLDFVKDELRDFCPLTWNVGATVTEQETSPIGGTSTDIAEEGRRKRDGSSQTISSKRTPDPHGGGGGGGSGATRYLRKLLAPIFSPPPKPRRERLLQAITVLDAQTVFEALYSPGQCPDKTPEEWATLIETFLNDNKEKLLDKLKAVHEYFADAFGVSADVLENQEVIVAVIETEEADTPLTAIIGGIIAALLLCCCCCTLPFLILRRRKEKENEIVGEDIEWARPVDEDHFPSLGGFRGDEDHLSATGSGHREGMASLRKRPDGEIPENDSTGPLKWNSIPAGLRPLEEDTEILHNTKWFDKDPPADAVKKKPFGTPGCMPRDNDEKDPYTINIYPGEDYDETEDCGDEIDLNHIGRKETKREEADCKLDDYEPDGGVRSALVDINTNSNRIPEKEEAVPSPEMIEELVLQRKKDLEAKMKELKHVEPLEAGTLPEEEEQVSPKPEPDGRIEDLITRINDLEKKETKKYDRDPKLEDESDYDVWRRLKKKMGENYMLTGRWLAVHRDASIHKWVKENTEKGEKDEDEERMGKGGVALDGIEMEGPVPMPPSDGGADVQVDIQERPDMSRMSTEHLGDMALLDSSDKTEYIGSIRGMDDDMTTTTMASQPTGGP